MKYPPFVKLTAMLICLLMILSTLPLSVLAAEIDENKLNYYQVISNREWQLAPGIVESEVVLNTTAGNKRQVCHVVEVDPYDPYTKVIPSTYKMADGLENKEYSTQVMSEQAAYAESHGYGNVVAAMNTALHWYDTDYYKEHPELIGEPLGTLILDGELYRNSQNSFFGAYTCLVINFDEKDGVPRPDNIPKTEVRQTYDAITGWEEQLIPTSFHFLVKNGVNQHVINDTTEPAPRSFLGIKEDGTIIIVMNEGRQAPFSTGFNCYEMAEFMISLGCVQAVNGDGGGSSTFLSQRPGEELELHCSPSDGAERATSHGVLVISTAPDDGEFNNAVISSEDDYYTPGSVVDFSAKGYDYNGASAQIPAEAVWQLSDSSFGTISDGVFTSNGKEGQVTVQLTLNGEVVGEDTVYIVTPDLLSFTSGDIVVPYGNKIKLSLNATYDGNSVVMPDTDVSLILSDPAIGILDGMYFTAAAEGGSAAEAILTASAYGLSATAVIRLGKGSTTVYSFENANDPDCLDGWYLQDESGSATGSISTVNRSGGKVKNGDFSLEVSCDFTQLDKTGEHVLTLNFPEISCDGSVSVGFWLYVPYDDCYADLDFGNGSITELYGLSEGWNYISTVTNGSFNSIHISVDDAASENYNAATEPNLNGKYTFYIDDITVDYSNATDDRNAPVFSVPTAVNAETSEGAAMNGQSVGFDKQYFEVAVADDTALINASGIAAKTAKAYIDGVEVDCVYRQGKIVTSVVNLADGIHTVKFTIEDNNANQSRVSGTVNVQSGTYSPAIRIVPQNADADRLPVGGVYWTDVIAADIAAVDTVELVFELNNASSWEFDGIELAQGFEATYAIQEYDNIATVIISRTAESVLSGEARLASIPVRTWTYNGTSSPAELVKNAALWAQSIELSLLTGKVTFVDSYDTEVFGSFGMEDVFVDTELFFNGAHKDNAEGAQAWIDECVSNGVGFHVHTPGTATDKAATSTESGYKGRVFCTDCGSAIEWGSFIPATGHVYHADMANKQIVCECGEVISDTGLYSADGKNYYVIKGTLTSGWLTVGDDWYYFHPSTYAGLDGRQTADQGVEFVFENGRLTDGVWVKSSAGIRYWYGPSYYKGSSKMTWYNIDGSDYCIDKNGYAATGTRWVNDVEGEVYTWYNFDENGTCRGKWNYTGLAQWNGNNYYLKNGVSQYGMYLVDGAYYYFYFTNYRAGIKNQEFTCNYNNGLLSAGVYRFGYDGRMVNNDVCNIDGILYYFVKGNISQGSGIFTYEGEDFTIEADGKVLFTGIIRDASGNYQYYENGVQSGTHTWDNGIVIVEPTCNTEGVRAYTCSDCGETKSCAIKVFAHSDENADFHCDKCGALIAHTPIWDNGAVTTYATCVTEGIRTYTCPCGETKTEAIAAPGHIDENGDLSCDYCMETLSAKTGLVFCSDGNVRYYVDGTATRAGLVMDSNGYYYYINSSLKAVKNTSYSFAASMSNGLLPAGTYQFDADGRIIDPPDMGVHLHSFDELIVTKSATCTEGGTGIYVCSCGFSKPTEIAADSSGHTWNDGVVTAPTCTDKGYTTYVCTACGDEYIGNYTDALGHSNIYETEENKVESTCSVKGSYEKVSYCGVCKVEISRESVELSLTEHTEEIISAVSPDCINTGLTEGIKCSVCGEIITEQQTVAALGHSYGDWQTVKDATATEDGLKQRSCLNGCGMIEEELIPALGVFELAVSSDGPNITISGMVDVKDVFIALGEYTVYRDVKNNMVVQLTTNKLNGASEYTYTLKEGGYYTVLVRYNDGSQKFLYEHIDVTEPTFSANGLQLTVGSLEGVKVIRTAYGTYKTVSEIKRAEGARAFTAKNDIKGADSYMVQYRYSGTVTVAVQYEDGYTKIYTYEVVQKTPDFKQDGSTVTIGNIDDLYVIRYAPGEWATSSEIKKAPDSKTVKAEDAAVNGVIAVRYLKAGTYTFCVQYNDESYNYYVIIVE